GGCVVRVRARGPGRGTQLRLGADGAGRCGGVGMRGAGGGCALIGVSRLVGRGCFARVLRGDTDGNNRGRSAGARGGGEPVGALGVVAAGDSPDGGGRIPAADAGCASGKPDCVCNFNGGVRRDADDVAVFVEEGLTRARRAPFTFRYTFYRFLSVASPLAESTTYGAVTVRERQKVPGIRVHLNAAKKQLDFFTTP